MPSKKNSVILSSRFGFAAVWQLLVGRPLRSSQASSEEINPIEGLPALSLDALTSVAYGPQAMIGILIVAGAGALSLTFPLTIAVVLLLILLVFSYRQVIEGFPKGGGAYAVAKQELGSRWSIIAASALFVDYTLNVAVSISAGIESLVSAFQPLAPYAVLMCIGMLLVISILNLRGLGEAARTFLLPTAVFIIGLFVIFAFGVIHPLSPHIAQPGASHVATSDLQLVGILLILKAFSSGCSALTGVEAIANGVPLFQKPKIVRAKQTMLLLGIILGAMLLLISWLVTHYHVVPRNNDLVLSQVMAIAVGRGWLFYTVSIAITVVLALAANTSFGGLPILANLLATDNYLPHIFALRGDRLVYSRGIIFLALLAAALLIAVQGNTQSLIPLFAIGVFIGFTLAQAGMVLHWKRSHRRNWQWRALLNGVGACVTGMAAIIFLYSKFANGAWIVAITIPVCYLTCIRIHGYYVNTGMQLGLGKKTVHPRSGETKIVVLIQSVSKMTERALSLGISLGNNVVAVSIIFDDDDALSGEKQFRKQWEQWSPGVDLDIVHTEYHSVVRPVIQYIRKIEHKGGEVIVILPEIEPRRFRHRIFHNQMGLALSSAIRHFTNAAVTILPFHLED